MWEFHITGQIKVQNTMAQIFCSNWLPPIVRMSPERKKMFIFFHRCNYVYTTCCKKNHYEGDLSQFQSMNNKTGPPQNSQICKLSRSELIKYCSLIHKLQNSRINFLNIVSLKILQISSMFQQPVSRYYKKCTVYINFFSTLASFSHHIFKWFVCVWFHVFYQSITMWE